MVAKVELDCRIAALNSEGNEVLYLGFEFEVAAEGETNE